MKLYIKADQDAGLDIQKLQSELTAAIKDFANSVGLDESYTRLDINETDDYIDIEVGAELEYEELEDLCIKLDDIIYKYDQDAYFETAEPGIINSRIWTTRDLIGVYINGKEEFKGELYQDRDGFPECIEKLCASDNNIYYTFLQWCIAQGYSIHNFELQSTQANPEFLVSYAVLSYVSNDFDKAQDNNTDFDIDLADDIHTNIAYDGTEFTPIHIIVKYLGKESRF